MTETQYIEQRQPPRLMVLLTIASAVLLLLMLAAGAVDGRLIDGVPIWAKPAKFAASFAVLFATIAWLETRLSPAWRDGRLLWLTRNVMGLMMAVEMAYIIFQAAQAEPSHFNLSTPFHAFMYTVVMFLGAVALVVGIGVYGYAAARDREAALTPGLRWGAALGFMLSFILTFFIAGYIGGNGGSLVGAPSAEAAVLPLVGWSTEVGDLRPAHFLALHAMQALPLLGWVLDKAAVRRATLAVAAGAVVYTALTIAVFAQALSGTPLIAL